ncbi:MmgE/PrpD family protein [Sphingorhabdus sp.]|jgi:2-methylcitrate dehydratase PrpD|uniref:MmgE/PrpD family protein n=1 Tax=Sphingorhabdus sp. TaxID=1902408 RepID=UPI0037C94B73
MSKSLSLTEQLAKHLQRKVDDATRGRARLHLLDWLGCVAGARGSKVASVVARRELGAQARSAYLGNVLEMDDIHRSSILHPGAVIWSAVLIASDDDPADFNNFLDAAVRGYEATIAIGATFDKQHYAYYHNTSTAGKMGAAAAAASVYQLTRKQTVDALGNAGSSTGGLWQMRHEDTMTKQFHISQAAHTGHWPAWLAQGGMTGPRFILEGPQGVYAATCKKPKPMEFPKRWRIWDVSFKPWGACRHAHPAIDGALELQELLGNLDGEIVVETYADAIAFCDNPHPKTPHQAKFSLQHAVAIVATSGVPTLADFEPAAIKRLAKTRARVSVHECKDITARYPQHYGARVRCQQQAVELIDTLGDPERPMSEILIIDKARTLMAWGGLTEKQANKAVKLALEGDDPAAIHRMLGKWLA